jgi:hypothetical protein
MAAPGEQVPELLQTSPTVQALLSALQEAPVVFTSQGAVSTVLKGEPQTPLLQYQEVLHRPLVPARSQVSLEFLVHHGNQSE